MADLAKLKRRSSLGAPPPAEEASSNLEAPETAPVPVVASADPITAQPAAPPSAPARLQIHPAPLPSRGQGIHPRDGRSARRSGRTLQFATRVSPEFDQRLRDIAERDRLLLVEVLERALDAYEAARSS
jgi:hypothetical protein